MTRSDTVWQDSKVAEAYLEGVRGGIPLAAFQVEMLGRVARHALPKVERILEVVNAASKGETVSTGRLL